MDKSKLAFKLAQMTRSMEAARRSRKLQQKYNRQTDKDAWERLKKQLNYHEPPAE